MQPEPMKMTGILYDSCFINKEFPGIAIMFIRPNIRTIKWCCSPGFYTGRGKPVKNFSTFPGYFYLVYENRGNLQPERHFINDTPQPTGFNYLFS
jgi:hypothetical protein